MTESEYLSCTDPAPMLAFAQDRLTEEQLRCYLNALIGRELPWSGLDWMKFFAADSEVIHKNPVRSCDLLRCVAGNPFRPVLTGDITSHPDWADYVVDDIIPMPFKKNWLTPAVIALARGVLEGDAPAWDRLPILADALEEAGCPIGIGVLEHLRNRVRCPACLGDGGLCQWCGDPRVRPMATPGLGWLPGPEPAIHCEGCWVLRLLLGEPSPPPAD